MKKTKSVNFSFLILTLLFILSQTAFALSATLNFDSAAEQVQVQQNNTVAANYIPRFYDIEGNRYFGEIAQVIEEDNSQQQERTQDSKVTLAATSEEIFSTSVLAASAEIAPVEPTPTPAPKITSVVKYVNANSLNVRKEANSSSDLVDTIKRGDKVTYYETVGEWARIITWSDKKGYVLAKHLVKSEKDVEKPAVIKTASVSRGTAEKTAEAPKPASTEALSLAEKIVSYAKTLQGVKYVYGGYSTKGFDCSGFTKYVFAKFDIYLPRSSSDYYGLSNKVSRSDLRAGDIVMFDIDGGSADVGHVGIYIGGGNFIHASSSKGKVVVRNLASYSEKYMGARRVIK